MTPGGEALASASAAPGTASNTPSEHVHFHVCAVVVQAGAEAMNERRGTDVQGGLVQLRRTRAVGLQTLRNDPQEDAQHHVEHHPVALYEVAQSFNKAL